MKVPTEKLIKAAVRKRAREGTSEGQQASAPRRLAVPAPAPPAPQELPAEPEIDLTADTPPERAVTEEVAPTEPAVEEPPMVEESTILDEPVSDEPARDWGEGPSGATSPPPEPSPIRSPPHAECETAECAEGERVKRRPPRDSVLNDGRWAEQLIAPILVPEVQEELSQLRAATFFRESYAALVRLANSLAATREVIHGGKGLIQEAQKEAEEARARAERAEESLELARTARVDEIKAAEDRAETEAKRAQAAEDRAEVEARRSRAALSQMMEAESAVAARNLHITELESVLREAETRAHEAKEKENKAEEELSRALEAERAAASSLATEKESRVAEVEAIVEARTAQIVENFKASELFLDELAEASAKAFLQGFQHGKEKVARDLNFPRALEVELECLPKAVPSDEEPAPGEP